VGTYFTLRPGSTVHSVSSTPERSEYVVETAEKRLYRLSGQSRAVLKQFELGRSLEDICDQLSQNFPGADGAELQSFVMQMYGPLLCPRDAPAEVAAQPSRRPLWKQNALFLEITVVREDFVRAVSKRLCWLYDPVVMLLVTLGVVATHVLCYSTSVGPLSASTTTATLVLCLLSVVAHELGHSTALLAGGGSPGGIGVGMFLLMPVFFADVSQVWVLPKSWRMKVDLGGIYFQQIAFTIFALIGGLTGAPSLRTACIAIDAMCLIAINPAFRFDGYWLLVDWLGIPKLRAKSHNFLMTIIRRAAGKAQQGTLLPPSLSKPKAVVFALYALLGNGFLAAAVLINLSSVRSSVVRAWHAIPGIYHEIAVAYHASNWLTVADSAIRLWFLCAFVVALFGMTALYSYRAAKSLRRWRPSTLNRSTSTNLFGGSNEAAISARTPR